MSFEVKYEVPRWWGGSQTRMMMLSRVETNQGASHQLAHRELNTLGLICKKTFSLGMLFTVNDRKWRISNIIPDKGLIIISPVRTSRYGETDSSLDIAHWIHHHQGTAIFVLAILGAMIAMVLYSSDVGKINLLEKVIVPLNPETDQQVNSCECN